MKVFLALAASFLLAVLVVGALARFFTRRVRRTLMEELLRGRHGEGLYAGREARGLAAAALLVLGAAPLAAWALGLRPALGLAVVFPLPAGLRWLRRLARAHRARSLDASALSFLHALRGLLRAGISLPAALFRLSETLPAPFAEGLGPFLSRFDDGRPLAECLARFRSKARLAHTGTLLGILETAYANGLPVLPVLDAMLPVLESEGLAAGRIRSVRRAVAGQMALAAAAPWALGGVLAVFQPEVAGRFAASPAFYPTVAGVAGLEALGGIVLWKVSAFP